MEREFIDFGKVSRLKREVTITEKIDGTNAAIIIGDGDLYCQSRNKVIDPTCDNAGFATWVHAHKAEIIEQLGPGCWFGEWWGSGIQRNYNLPKGEKRFSLFNTHYWHGDPEQQYKCIEAPLFYVAPVLAVGEFNTQFIDETLANLAVTGSQASPGFMRPEGIVVFHSQNQALYKVTYEYDVEGKGKNR